MYIYYGLIILFVLSCIIFEPLQSQLKQRCQFFFCAIPATLVAALRDITVGTDTQQYADAELFLRQVGYDAYLHSGTMYSNYEPGFRLFLLVCSWFHDPLSSMIVLSSLIIVVIPFYVYYKLATMPGLCYIMHFLTTLYYFGLSNMRQAMAISFICVSVYLFINNRIRLSIVFVFIATMFHLSSLFVIPIMILARKKPTPMFLCITLSFTLPLLVFGNYLSSIFTSLPKYMGYTDSDYVTPGHFLPVIQLVMFGMLLVFSVNEYNHCIHTNYVTEKLTKVTIYSCIFCIFSAIGALYVNVFYRFMYICLPVICIYCANTILEQLNKKHILLVFNILMMFICFFVSFNFVDSSWFGIEPYSSVLAA